MNWSAGDLTRTEAYASDFVRLFKPDVLLSQSSANLAALQRATSTIPIVFLSVADPVEQGFVPNPAHPGGNITGFGNPEFSIAGKLADLIKQMAPSINGSRSSSLPRNRRASSSCAPWRPRRPRSAST